MVWSLERIGGAAAIGVLAASLGCDPAVFDDARTGPMATMASADSLGPTDGNLGTQPGNLGTRPGQSSDCAGVGCTSGESSDNSAIEDDSEAGDAQQGHATDPTEPESPAAEPSAMAPSPPADDPQIPGDRPPFDTSIDGSEASTGDSADESDGSADDPKDEPEAPADDPSDEPQVPDEEAADGEAPTGMVTSPDAPDQDPVLWPPPDGNPSEDESCVYVQWCTSFEDLNSHGTVCRIQPDCEFSQEAEDTCRTFIVDLCGASDPSVWFCDVGATRCYRFDF